MNSINKDNNKSVIITLVIIQFIFLLFEWNYFQQQQTKIYIYIIFLYINSFFFSCFSTFITNKIIKYQIKQ